MSALARLAWAALALPVAYLAALGAYLGLLTGAALLASRQRKPPPAGPRGHHFAVLVPAHDEEGLVGRLVANLRTLDYPADRFDVHVVADNCTDATAALARAAGALVHERHDPALRGKGYALRWLLQRLGEQHHGPYDAYVVFDADSVVAPNFLASMDARLAAGARAIQAYYGVLNADESPVAALRAAALAGIHYVRPLGRARLGLSAGLKGNGMCLAAPLLEQAAWSWFNLAEDVEMHLALVGQGVRVEFAPETWVRAEMPVTLAQAASQNTRWERGRVEQARGPALRLLRDGLRQRSALCLDAALEQLIPPLSIPFALAGVCLLLAVTLRAWRLATLAASSLLSQVAQLLVGLALTGAPLSTYRALCHAPRFIAWKVGLYARALLAAPAAGWVRTARRAPPDG